MSKKTLVLGASENPSRYSNMAINRLRRHGHEVVAIGLRQGQVLDVPIITGKPELKDIDTVTLYMNPVNQEPYLDYIIGLNPKRIVFNPGTENQKLVNLAMEKDIDPVYGCTLVMLGAGQY